MPLQLSVPQGLLHSGQHVKVMRDLGTDKMIRFIPSFQGPRYGAAVMSTTAELVTEVSLGSGSHPIMTMPVLHRSVPMLPPQLCHWLN